MSSDDIDERLLALSLRQLVEQLPYDVWIRDESDKMLFANAALRERWGKGLEGRTVDETEVQAGVADTWRTTNARALAGETMRRESVYSLDGVLRTIVGLVTPIRDGDKIRGTVGINLDITD